MPRWTRAKGFVVDGGTGCLLGAERKFTRILALPPTGGRIWDTGILIRALGVTGALVRFGTSSLSITNHAWLTFADERAWLVFTNHACWTDIAVLTLVDVLASLGCADVALGTLALASDTCFSILAVYVLVTSWTTVSVPTNLALQAILVLDTNLQAGVANTVFSSSTITVQVAVEQADPIDTFVT